MRSINLLKIYMPNIVLILFLILCSGLGCNDDPTKPIDPPDNLDIVPQTDILWPSLADSPWPMHHHDPQSTGRSKYIGPQNGQIVKTVPVSMEAGLSIGYDNTVIIPQFGGSYNVFASDYDGNVKWMHENLTIYSTPTISKDSVIYLSGGDYFYALSNAGEIIWKYNVPERTINLSNVLDKEGNVYFLSGKHTLNAISKDGVFLWKIVDDRIGAGLYTTPTFSPDGNVIYLQGVSVSLIAIDIKQQKILWTFGNNYLCTSPLIDSDGNIIMFPVEQCWVTSDLTIYSINKSGQLNWEYSIKDFHMPSNIEATIDYDGNIYMGADTLYSFTNGGKLRWKQKFKDNFRIISPLICDLNNTIYLGLVNDQNGVNKVMSLNNNGQLLWEIVIEDERNLGMSPALTENGLLIYPTWRGSNYIIIK